MANRFWNFITQMVAGELARAEDVNTNLSGVQTGLDNVEEELDRSIQVLTTPGTTHLSENVSNRANKLIQFNTTGDIELGTVVGNYRGNHADAAGTDYYVRDVVKDAAARVFLNNLYICNTAHTSTGQLNTDIANFDLLVSVAEVEAAKVAAEAAQAAAEAVYDNFDDRYLGAKASDPTLDNDGDALITGALYFNTTIDKMKVRTSGAAWVLATANAADVNLADAGGLYTATDVEAAFTEVVTLANAQTVTGAKTFSADVTVGKANPTLLLEDSGAADALVRFKDLATTRALVYWTRSADNLILQLFNPAGSVAVAQLVLSSSGKVNVGVGDLQIAGTDLYDIVPRLAVANTFTENQTLDCSVAQRQINFQASANLSYLWGDVGGDIGLLDSTNARHVWRYDESANKLNLSSSVVDVIEGNLRIAGVDVDAIFARLDSANTFIENQLIQKINPQFNIDNVGAGGSGFVAFKNSGVQRALVYWNSVTDSLILAQYDSAVSTTVRAQIALKETGIVDIPTGQLLVSGITNPYINLKSTSLTGIGNYQISDSNNVGRAQFIFDDSTDLVSLKRFNLSGPLQTELSLESDGNVSVNGAAPTQAANLIRKDWAESVFAQLAVANVFSADQTISKATPVLALSSVTTGEAIFKFQDGVTTRCDIFWSRSLDQLNLRQYDADGATNRAEISLTELGKVNISVGTLQLAGVDVTANASELSILDGVTSTTAELNILDGSATVQATVTLVGTDGVVISDADVMKQALVSDFATFVSANLANPVFTGTLTVGAAQLSEAELEILDGATVTTAELNATTDGSTAATATTCVGADRVPYNDAGVMKQVSLDDLADYIRVGTLGGALVYRTTALTALADGAWVAIGFDAEEYDDNSIHDTVTNNSRLTVPTGVTKVRVKAQVEWRSGGGAATGFLEIGITKNTTFAFTGAPEIIAYAVLGSAASFRQQVVSPVLHVVAGQYFELQAQQTTGTTNMDVQGTSGGTWFELEILK